LHEYPVLGSFRADLAACDATSKRCFPLLQTL
jgi:hypothetical protein